MTEFTISILATVDPVVRSAMTVNLSFDDPPVVTVTYDLLDSGVRRMVADSSGIIELTVSDLEHPCLSCAIRHDVIPSIERLRADVRWNHAIVALPLTAEPAPLIRYLAGALGRHGLLAGCTYGASITAVDARALHRDVFSDVFSDVFLADLDLAINDSDDRVLSEALAPMLTTADVILLTTDDQATDTALAVADHLAGLGTRVIDSGLSSLRAGDIVAGPGVLRDALRRIDPLDERRRSAHDRAGVWTLTLDSERAFHPARLRINLHRLAGHCVRSRGQFWVPSRPGSACIWEGTGRQLSVGEQGPSRENPPRTRIVITGIGDERDALLSAFSDSLAFPDELDATSDRLDDWFPQGDH